MKNYPVRVYPSKEHLNREKQLADFIRKFQTLSEGLLTEVEQERFLSLVQNLPNLSAAQVADINVEMDLAKLNVCINKGIF